MRVTTSLCGLMLVGVLFGCTNDDDTTLDLGTTTTTSHASTTMRPTTTTTTVVATTTSSTTTTAASTTTEVAPTEPPTTVGEPTTSAVPTTVAPTPLTPEEQVTADYLAAFEARQDCAYNPADCDYSMVSFAGSPFEAFLRQQFASRIEQNIRPIAGQGEVRVKVESVTIGSDSATVVACTLDSIILFDIGDPTTPDDDVIVDDSTTSSRVSWEMRLAGARWLPYSGTNLEQAPAGGDLCGLA